MRVRRTALVAAVLLAAVGLGLGAVTTSVFAAEPAFTAYGADGSGTGVHVLGYTNGLTNFASGFLDNAYPLAVSHIDAAPAAQAVASVADTGPLGATGVGQVQANVPNVASQPQYAIASYPGRPTASLSQGTSVAEASADQDGAQSRGAVGAVGTGGSVESDADVAHTSGDEGSSRARVDQVARTVIAAATGHVSRAVFGSGVLKIADVNVTAGVTSDGSKATPSYTIAVGSATVNGMPVAITEKGVVVQNAPLPGSDAVTQVVNGQLNQALASEGLAVRVTAPTITTSAGQSSVQVSGVHVSYTAPNPNPSVPTLTFNYILGEARAFAFGVLATGSDAAPEPVGAAVDAGSVDSTDIGSVSGAIVSPSPELSAVGSGLPTTRSGRSSTAGLLSVSARRVRPTWLVPIYFIWQALVLATAGALVWSRGDPRG